MLQTFNHYGIDVASYEACAYAITQSNRQHARIINRWFLLTNMLYLVCAHFGWLNVDARNQDI